MNFSMAANPVLEASFHQPLSMVRSEQTLLKRHIALLLHFTYLTLQLLDVGVKLEDFVLHLISVNFAVGKSLKYDSHV